jgi:formate C-acetyltransferase
MTDRMIRLRDYIVAHKHFDLRQPKQVYENIDISVYRDKSLSHAMRVAKRFELFLKSEVPVLLPEERIAFTRTLPALPPVLTEDEFDEIRATGKYIHEKGFVTNIAPDYGKIMSKGLYALLDDVKAKLKTANDNDKEFYQVELITLNAIVDFALRYKQFALDNGYIDIYNDLCVVPFYPAKTFKQALQFLRLIHFCIWVEGEYHVILGRFDQFMYPYLKQDLDKGILNEDSALEVLEDFFISCNKDTDLYPGLQQGDNGQSIMLGGYDENGVDSYNILSDLCMRASYDLKVIDPKINLRVNKDTPKDRLLFASKLTTIGLGFPQYSNDDIVIPGLLKLGYDKKDVYNYCVAACWEFIIPGCGMETVNISAMSYVVAVNNAIKKHGKDCKNIEDLLSAVKNEITDYTLSLLNTVYDIYLVPAPFMSLMFDGCFENAKDISLGNKYNNYGQHGFGLGNAVDSIVCFNHFVNELKEISAEKYLEILENDFVGNDEFRNKLINYPQKFGNGIKEVDDIASVLLKTHSKACKSFINSRGGICRAGTGSANCYVVANNKKYTASADGRLRGDFLPANYTPSITIKTKGPLSVIKSLTTPDLSENINGGPATFEFTASSVNSKTGVEKLALLVENFIKLGGHQLQLNVINKDELIKAQQNPSNYKNLIVRVWGWSGYFVELDKCYQDQVILRADYSL